MDNNKSVFSIMQAQTEAMALGDNFVATEHILLGLLSQPQSVAARALSKMEIAAESIREQLKRNKGHATSVRGASLRDGLPFTSDSKRCLQLAWDEAKKLGHNYISSEHLILGILRHPNCGALMMLKKRGVNPNELRIIVLSLIADNH